MFVIPTANLLPPGPAVWCRQACDAGGGGWMREDLHRQRPHPHRLLRGGGRGALAHCHGQQVWSHLGPKQRWFISFRGLISIHGLLKKKCEISVIQTHTITEVQWWLRAGARHAYIEAAYFSPWILIDKPHKVMDLNKPWIWKQPLWIWAFKIIIFLWGKIVLTPRSHLHG